MSAEWQESPTERPQVPLGALVRNFDSRRIPLSRQVRAKRPGLYRYYGATGVMDHIDAYLFDGLHLLVAEDGSVESPTGVPYLQLVNGKFWVSNHAHVLQGSTDEETRYLYYALSTVPVRPFVSGSVQEKLSQANLNQIPVPYPTDESNRSAIAHVLGTLDDKIELNRRMNETLEGMARAIFQDWFVDFGPVRAKMEGREPYLPPEVWSLFPERLVDTELGEAPEGWGVGCLDDMIQLLSGGTPRTTVSDYWDGEIPWYTAKDAPSLSDIFVLDTERSITQAGIENSATSVLPIGTTIITARGTVGKLACLGVPMAMNQTCYGIRGAHGYPDIFTYWNVRTAVDELQQRTHGTIFDTITRQTFKLVEAALPPVEQAKTFEATVKPTMERVLNNLRESRTLAAQRDALLPPLVSGAVGVGGTVQGKTK